MKKTKRFYTVTYIPSLESGEEQSVHTHSVCANSAQSAARLCFRLWIKDKLIKRQPQTDDVGEYIGVGVELL